MIKSNKLIYCVVHRLASQPQFNNAIENQHVRLNKEKMMGSTFFFNLINHAYFLGTLYESKKRRLHKRLFRQSQR